MPTFLDRTGRQYNRLTVIKLSEEKGINGKLKWICRCTCGKEVCVLGDRLTSNHTKSCGCLSTEASIALGKNKKKHGMSGSLEYYIWINMKIRCFKKTSPYYKNYGARGITVCDRWKNSFHNFYQDMGPKPGPEHSLDRIENDGNYEPGNCRWATMIEQNNNRRNSNLFLFRGSYASIAMIARLTGIPQPTLVSRVKRMKLSIDEAVELTLKGRVNVWS